jgi:hypothetical protein
MLSLMATACSQRAEGPRAVVTGGDAGGIPRVQPAEEHFDSAALERVSTDATASGLQALIVLRHGYIVFDRYGHGVDAQSMRDLGGFAQVMVALVTGIAVQEDVFPLPARSAFEPTSLRDAIESGAHQAYPDYLSFHLWRRLNASPAWIALTAAGSPAPADCCLHARVFDWMRVGELLAEDGRFEGKQLVPPGWVARMRQPAVADESRGFGVQLPAGAHGAEAFAADDVFFLRGPGHWRLWLVPSLQLAVLFGADGRSNDAEAGAGADGWDETRLANLVIRAISDPSKPANAASRLNQLVPGH